MCRHAHPITSCGLKRAARGGTGVENSGASMRTDKPSDAHRRAGIGQSAAASVREEERRSRRKAKARTQAPERHLKGQDTAILKASGGSSLTRVPMDDIFGAALHPFMLVSA